MDIGCADAELSLFFERLGFSADAVDHASSNHNRLEGARALIRAAGSAVRVRDLDLDRGGELPAPEAGLVLCLGLLYHLKKPFLFLERLAQHSHYCLFNTKLLTNVPAMAAAVDSQPLAYLLDSAELNGDDSNFWLFTRAALARLLHRTGRRVLASLELEAGAERRRGIILLGSRERRSLRFRGEVFGGAMSFHSFQASNIVRRMHQLQARVQWFGHHARTLSRLPGFDGRLLLGEATQLIRELTQAVQEFQGASASAASLKPRLSPIPPSSSGPGKYSYSGPPPAAKWGNEFRAAEAQFVLALRRTEKEIRALQIVANEDLNSPTRVSTAPESMLDVVMTFIELLNAILRRYRGTK